MRDRIYIFVPRVLKLSDGVIAMPPGRMGAQCAHIAAAMAKKFKGLDRMTTLILQIRNQDEFPSVKRMLKREKIRFFEQRDNFEPYESKMILQAIATEPITKDQSFAMTLFDLWK